MGAVDFGLRPRSSRHRGHQGRCGPARSRIVDTRVKNSPPDTDRGNAAPGTWHFGVAQLDETNARLTINGVAHELEHSSYQLLRSLLRHAGQVVHKERLLEIGWPGRVVSENSLTKAIGRLRHVLQDAEGQILTTVHGYGYRLAQHAEFVLDAPPAPTETPKPELRAAPQASGLRRPPVWSVLSMAALVLVAWLAWPSRDTSRANAPQAAASGPPSIAVLPFADMSQAGDQAYFSDGLADELLDQLSRLPQLHVAGRTSSFSFRGKNDDIASIGRKLHVTHVLEGSVRKSADRVRITVQLINVANGFHLWSETYDRKMTDLFAVQDDIARSVVAALQLKLLPGQDDLVTHHFSVDPVAYTDYLIGRQLRGLQTPDDDRRAIAAYERSIARDPKFAPAHAALADVLGGNAEYSDTPEQVAEGKRRSLELFDKAIALDPGVAQTYRARADVRYSTNWDWAGAQRDLDQAERINPGEHTVDAMLRSRVLASQGRLDEAIALDKRSTERDPTAGSMWGMLGFHSAAAGQYAQAHQALAQARKLIPNDVHVNFYTGLTSLLEGNAAEAAREFEVGGGGFRLAGLAMSHHSLGDDALAAQELKTLISKYSDTSAYQIAEVYAWKGDAERAFQWLDRAAAQRDAGLIFLKFDPLLATLRSDRRYVAWLKRMGLST